MVIYAHSPRTNRNRMCGWALVCMCLHIENIAFGRNNKIELCHAKHKHSMQAVGGGQVTGGGDGSGDGVAGIHSL